MTEPLGLDGFNAADPASLAARLNALTAAPDWVREMVADRPYPGIDAVLERSDAILASIGADQIDTALAGHPRIGEKARHLDAESAARSAAEQAGMLSASTDVTSALAAANAAYEERFGRIYLVAAAGLSADELLAKAQDRLTNDPVTELDVVRGELARITRLRLIALLT